MEDKKRKPHSVETRKKLSIQKLGSKNPQYGKHLSEYAKQRIREANLGKKMSEETKKKISEANKGKTRTIEQRMKISLSHKGILCTEEQKNKISISLKGRKRTEEQKNHYKGRKLSLEERQKIRERTTGEKNWNWKGGITPTNKKIRRSENFKSWRESVFARDNWTCQECKKRGIEIHPHHIKEFCNYPELRFDVSNGITLCLSCHKKTKSWGRNVLPKLSTLPH